MQVDECDEEGYGAPEEYGVDCLSEDFNPYYSDDSLDMFPAEVEDLGKRKGTNDARDNIVKKLRETPPNADATMGGYRSVPVQKMPSTSRGAYKTYKTVPDKKAIARKEGKDVMTKPVAVPLNHYMGLTFLGSKDRSKLANKLASDANNVLQAFVDTVEVPEDPNSPVDVAPLEINPLQASTAPSNAVSQTLYVPILFPKCSTPQWALVDTGAQLSLITTGCAQYCNLVEEGFTNVLASDLKVGGVSGAPW